MYDKCCAHPWPQTNYLNKIADNRWLLELQECYLQECISKPACEAEENQEFGRYDLQISTEYLLSVLPSLRDIQTMQNVAKDSWLMIESEKSKEIRQLRL